MPYSWVLQFYTNFQMRLILLITLSLILFTTVQAQDALLALVSDEVCECMDSEIEKGHEDMTSIMTDCMRESFIANKKNSMISMVKPTLKKATMPSR